MAEQESLLSETAANRIDLASSIIAGISILYSLAILLAAGWVWSVRSARATMDRLSFRLMLWSMLFSIGYDLCYILAYPELDAINIQGPQCTAVMYWQTVCMSSVNYFCTCIAVNLMLTICFSINPVALRLERWYLIVSLVLGFGLPMIPAALGHFGGDPVYEACYFTAPDLRTRLRNFVVDLYLWQTIAMIIACASVVATLVTLFRSGRDTAKALLKRDTSEHTLTLSEDSRQSRSQCKLKSIFRRRSADSHTYTLQDRFLGIAFRISLYPIAIVIMNVILTVADLYLSTTGEVKTKAEYGLYVVYYVLYGGRNIVLASIGMFVDPCLFRGVRVAWEHTFSHSAPARPPFADFDSEDVDFATALASVSYNGSVDPSYPTPMQSRARPETFSKSFHGVASGSLPKGMTDDVDVDLQVPPQLVVTVHRSRSPAELEEARDVQSETKSDDLDPASAQGARRPVRFSTRAERLRKQQEKRQAEEKFNEVLMRL